MDLPIFIGSSFAFDWDDGNREKNWLKHGIAQGEAEEPFFDANQLIFPDIKHSGIEERYVLIGKTLQKRLLTIIFTLRGNKARIISARPASRKEADIYEKAA